MIRFNSDNIIVGEIKQLLKTFNLPCCKVFTPRMFVVKGEYYIKYPYLYRCKKTGFADSISNDIFDNMQVYTYGEKIRGITKNYALDSLIYDTHIHKYLGEYLRFYSDYYGINLMSMYNCFSNETANSLDFGKSFSESISDVLYKNGSDYEQARVKWGDNDYRNVQVKTTVISINHDRTYESNSKIYAVPIKLFKEYTIGIDCNTPVELMLDFYNRDFEITVINKETMDKLHNYSYKIERDCKFNRPFLFSKALFSDGTFSNDVLEEFLKQEDSFRLLIKVPNKNNSSISVVEGNYIKNCEKVFDNSGKVKLGNIPVICDKAPESAYTYITTMELFKINSQVQHPFANRLIEYLTDNVISNEDTIEKNIERVQLSLYHPKDIGEKSIRRLPMIKAKGIWDDSIKQAIFKDCIREKCLDKYDDLLYYVDKDVESDIIKEALSYVS